MHHFILEQLKKHLAPKLIASIFVLLTFYWLYISYLGFSDNDHVLYFTLIYPMIAVIGGVAGLVYGQKWGGFKSALGKSISLLSLGLLAQFLGQLLYNYYVVFLGVEVPYPSIGDISYFASVLLYLAGVWHLALVGGVRLTFTSLKGRILAIIVPLAMLCLSYYLLLSDYDFESSGVSLIFLDFGFPVGQALFVSLALLVLLTSKNILAGIMRPAIILLTIALVAQFIADFLFSYLYSSGHDVYMLDYLYAAAYFLMAFALVSIGNMFYKIKES